MWKENNEKGASAVEFALVLPVLMLVLFGIIEFGFIFFNKAIITNASREGARRGIVQTVDVTTDPPTPTAVPVADIMSTVASYCATYLVSLGNGAATPSTTITGNCAVPGSSLTVAVTYPYTFLVLPDLSSFYGSLPGGITLGGTTVMRCENQ